MDAATRKAKLIELQANENNVAMNLWMMMNVRLKLIKAISRNQAFFWSKNELEIARLQGDKYCLYLVNLSKIGDSEYAPIIIQNPALSIMRSPDWLVEPESYHVQKISC